MTVTPSLPLVTISLDANGVGVAAQLAAKEVYDIFAVSYPALQAADLRNVAPLADEVVHHQMEILGRSPVEERASVMRRLMAMCISDLARGIRQTLEDASTHAELLRTSPEMFRPGEDSGSVDDQVALIESAVLRYKTEALEKAQAMRYPQLLAKVQTDLAAPLQWAPELTSFQKVRNCLEHRGGIVGSQDLDGTNTLSLSLPYLEVEVIEHSGSRVPFRIGMPLEEASAMHVKVAVGKKTFKLGESIVVEPKQIGEIAFAVWLFAIEIVEKLSTGAGRSARVAMHI
ncbi:hypothetical protein [Aminobacter aminovorans]|uniref:hypothetical protein n=1 Tax=Aminobacter aminovorans TaxID=83263 RepID=UPI0028641D42|nr:hypothetical protein [Aminobacter aminovorans]MDR7225251.1 hypothetical protein [Aminobacter aminovorans]